jgi:DNA invertase Pin-like site-specific DNA recombinase
MLCDAYIRVSKSSGRGEEEDWSPHKQRRRIEDWAKAHGHIVRDAEHVDLDESGGSMTRPAWDKLMEEAKRGKIKAIVVAKADRYTRTTMGGLKEVERLEKYEVDLWAVKEGKLSHPNSKVARGVGFLVAEEQRDQIKEYTEEGKASAVRRGLWMPSPPFGYDKVEKRLRPNSDAKFVKKAFVMRAKGASYPEIAAELNDLAPRAGAGWSWIMVQRLIINPAYKGEILWGRKKTKNKPAPKTVYRNPNAHKPIVTPAQWQKAQLLANTHSWSPNALPSLLGGLVRCQSCRYKMMLGGGDKASYQCTRDHNRNGRCPSPANINKARLEAYVLERFHEHADKIKREPIPDTGIEAALQEELDGLLDQQREYLRRDFGATPDDVVRRGADELQEQIEQTQAKLGASNNQTDLHKLDLSGMNRWTVEQQHKAIASLIDVIFIKPGIPYEERKKDRLPIESRTILCPLDRGTPDDLPGRGKDNGPIRPLS